MTDTTGADLVVLGTAAGPRPTAVRHGISSALVVNGDIYVIDCGRGAVAQFVRAGLDPTRVRAIFITHLHIDHWVDYFGFATLVSPPGLATSSSSVDVYGPGSAGALPPAPPGGYLFPDAPTPGIAQMTRLLAAADASSSNFFRAEHLAVDPMLVLRAHDITLPVIGASSLDDPAPPMEPFPVYRDANVSVTAILVPHGAVFPAFAFRFDTAEGSIAFSGDTALTPNIPTLARDVDILVHEAVDTSWPAYARPGIHRHMTDVHTEVTRIGEVAVAANARTLLLSHLGPAERSNTWWTRQARTSAHAVGYAGRVEAATELHRYPLRPQVS